MYMGTVDDLSREDIIRQAVGCAGWIRALFPTE